MALSRSTSWIHTCQGEERGKNKTKNLQPCNVTQTLGKKNHTHSIKTTGGSYCKLNEIKTLTEKKKPQLKNRMYPPHWSYSVMLWNTWQTPSNQPHSALHFARSTALYGDNSDVRECRTASLWETGGRPNKNSKSCFFFAFSLEGPGLTVHEEKVQWRPLVIV